MANHQHGRDRRGARNRSGSRPQAAGGPAWTAPAPPPGTPRYIEPEVRRWPHPVEGGVSEPAPEPALHYIRCAVSYQNQILADIKALLEQLAINTAKAPEAGTPEDGSAKT